MSADTSPAIELRGASKTFRIPSGGLHTAVRDLDLAVGRGEFVAVVGPTGCGKSLTSTLVSGLEEPTEGEVLVAGEPVRGVGDKVGFVLQQDATFPDGVREEGHGLTAETASDRPPRRGSPTRNGVPGGPRRRT
ncbi:ATP-binding cassette domain-containing protein [Streptomyces coeruleorubidus]|uniref:ATP-binding cassette domain-containing protein n=1 Tax=Streptomyces coeruleorubidus TaxID=116188 RepID=UPI003680F7F8